MRKRYQKQTLLPEIGEEGQERLFESRVVVVGCGALGSVIANTLVRMGVGSVIIADRDYVEEDNIHRQILFDESDIKENLPKAVAAYRKLERVNSSVHIKPVVTDINAENILSIIDSADCVIDGTDNFETRFLINDACYRLRIPWIYGGVIGTNGMSFTIIPGLTACFRCFIRDMPAVGETQTCDTAGVLPTVVSITASIETTEAIKILVGRKEDLLQTLFVVDVWKGSWDSLSLEPDEHCPLCGEGRYDFLESRSSSRAVSLCGKNAVQITPREKITVDFDHLAGRLKNAGEVTFNEFILKFTTGDLEISLFKTGRAIIKGIEDETSARIAFSKYIGI